ncbi:PREDICTED: uncharacterized protein LOC108568492 [Nicrophorus vespilloides]|uniref:Uncharacterized protein LOC108568492 n=1 Tax=Nicrophorus vespilloides TaxID=110193 RepID=A0ABM1NE52_NICVS|nr:PREDICTED: uncharacterized protein LOC108568492 [Nicrophorus vespilloides]
MVDKFILFLILLQVLRVQCSSFEDVDDEDSGSIEIPARFLQSKSNKGSHNEIIKQVEKQDNLSLLEFIGRVLNTAQHRCKMAVERAKKRASLSKTITEDAEKLLQAAAHIKL